MILRLNFYFNYFNTNLIVLIVFAFISTIANDVQNCTIGVLDDCPPHQICTQLDINQELGRCICISSDCPTDPSITVKPLPYHSNDNNSNNSSVIISTIFGSIIAILIMFSAYYFGIRKGLFHNIWLRTFTQRQVEHQLLDRSHITDDNNDSEAIA